MKTTITGTPNFKDLKSAIKYYSDYEDDPEEAVNRKLESKEIFIGKPELKENEKLLLDTEEGRYKIERFFNESSFLHN